ncbi:uncharacterized protein LOC143231043 isoform X2 [Tachypleus tridentatus]|uniref:uncharacterized protein LOC143231043 isoform X2 n=1 Tax=Tachypleus tridentatus TaxID=6853 RepID=UPI003FD113CB
MTMERVNLCHEPLRISKSCGGTLGLYKEMVVEDGIQVVSNHVNIGSEKQRTGFNSIPVDCGHEQGHTMSWEGGLLDEETDQELDTRMYSIAHDSNLPIGRQSSLRPESPMCLDENFPLTTARKTSSLIKEAESMPNSHASSPVIRPNTKPHYSLPNTTSAAGERTLQSYGSVPSLLIDNSLPFPTTSGPYSEPYSQSPSPVYVGLNGNCSSRSSQSPGQSPFLSRHVSGLSSSGYSNVESPMLSCQPVQDITDTFAKSQRNILQQDNKKKIEKPFYSPNQSPSHRRHHYPDGSISFSSSPNSARRKEAMLSRPIPFDVSPSPTFHHSNQRDTFQYPHNPLSDGSGTQRDVFSNRTSEASSYPHHSNMETTSTVSRASLASNASDESNTSEVAGPPHQWYANSNNDNHQVLLIKDISQCPLGYSGTSGGISRQQLLSGPCPICGDRISGFHYGIFSCESCKGFFKRTVQNRKNYVCLRGVNCHVAINTRKKCPACRFNKCLKMGMKLEAIREDRTRGGRSTYQCSYPFPSQSVNDPWNQIRPENAVDVMYTNELHHRSETLYQNYRKGGYYSSTSNSSSPFIPQLIHDIMSVEHLWHYSGKESTKIPDHLEHKSTHGDFLTKLCRVADDRLYKIVKWCKSLPLFKDVQKDDQIALLINSWCEILLLSCCYRSMFTSNQVCISRDKSVNLQQAQQSGICHVIERMLSLIEHFRRLQLDKHEFVCLKVIILLTSDVSGLKDPDKVRNCQKQVLEALQAYTYSHYPNLPSKFGELLLRVPELERACQFSKESLDSKQRSGGDASSFHLLVELLRDPKIF